MRLCVSLALAVRDEAEAAWRATFFHVPGRFANDWLEVEGIGRASVVVTAGGARDRPFNTVVVSGGRTRCTLYMTPHAAKIARSKARTASRIVSPLTLADSIYRIS